MKFAKSLVIEGANTTIFVTPNLLRVESKTLIRMFDATLISKIEISIDDEIRDQASLKINGETGFGIYKIQDLKTLSRLAE